MRKTDHRPKPGFSLIELIVAISIIALLIALLLPTLGKARQAAEMTRELSAARSLMLSHALYAQDYKLRLIPGYDITASANDQQGNALHFPTTARYPWRLAPYLDHQFRDSVLVNQRLEDLGVDFAANAYAISAHPSFGINGDFVGGTWGGPYNNWLRGVGVTVQRSEDATSPASLIVFASARGGTSGSNPIFGHHFVAPSYGVPYDDKALPSAFGFVHPRYDNRAVVSFLDTHAGLKSPDELLDMTLWSDAAQRANKPDWTLSDALP